MRNLLRNKTAKYISMKAENGVEIWVDPTDPYKYPLARMKSYLIAYARCFLSRMLVKRDLVPYVLRIHTDGIAFDREIEFPATFSYHNRNEYYPIPEDKSTGLLAWSSVSNNDVYEARREEKKKGCFGY
ncbi:MAG: hypothetical protein EOO43_20715 [Flavobacterium sp.]|nr:MAG: hypothetical protein EOO43_20715 [Flavobacterium sp.]